MSLKNSTIKSFEDLPLFLNADQLAAVLGVSISSAYELMGSKNFPSLRIGKRLLVPREKLILWVNEQCGGGRRG